MTDFEANNRSLRLPRCPQKKNILLRSYVFFCILPEILMEVIYVENINIAAG